ncbi:hypothetical protein RN629_14035 [Sphingomonadaceae bacterium jetA1]|jgi:hypothetical protein|uniref:hypothetical protein n=1 Tax=Facivitalis istanbulensis TaxID=3075838 RepID=UPI003487A321
MKWGMLAAAMLCVAAPVAAEVLNNQTVVTLVQAGLGEEADIAKIKASPNRFDLGTDQLIALKKQGVPSPVIAAMLSASQEGGVSAKASLSADSPDWRVPHPAGIYLLADEGAEPKMQRLDPTTANQTKTGGMLGYALTGGIASIKMKSVIPNDHARIRSAKAKPEFYFYFDEANASLSSGANGGSWLTGPNATITSPNEFSLVRFDVKKDHREARVGSFSIGGAKSGVMDKDRIAFTYDRVANGVFRVSPNMPLEPGEYGFLYSISAGGGPGMFDKNTMTKVFDFSIGQ